MVLERVFKMHQYILYIILYGIVFGTYIGSVLTQHAVSYE